MARDWTIGVDITDIVGVAEGDETTMMLQQLLLQQVEFGAAQIS